MNFLWEKWKKRLIYQAKYSQTWKKKKKEKNIKLLNFSFFWRDGKFRKSSESFLWVCLEFFLSLRKFKLNFQCGYMHLFLNKCFYANLKLFTSPKTLLLPGVSLPSPQYKLRNSVFLKQVRLKVSYVLHPKVAKISLGLKASSAFLQRLAEQAFGCRIAWSSMIFWSFCYLDIGSSETAGLLAIPTILVFVKEGNVLFIFFS